MKIDWKRSYIDRGDRSTGTLCTCYMHKRWGINTATYDSVIFLMWDETSSEAKITFKYSRENDLFTTSDEITSECIKFYQKFYPSNCTVSIFLQSNFILQNRTKLCCFSISYGLSNELISSDKISSQIYVESFFRRATYVSESELSDSRRWCSGISYTLPASCQVSLKPGKQAPNDYTSISDNFCISVN